MALPTNRDDFKDYCLRRLGAPVINIEISDEQVDDAVDFALKKFWDYHFDGSEHVYFKYALTQKDIDNKYITLPDNIIGAIGIFDIGFGSMSGSFFSIEYQIALNDLYQLTTISLLPYYMSMYQLQTIQQMLTGMKSVRYNRNTNKFYVDMNWKNVNVGDFLVIDAQQVVNPDTYGKVWQNTWLIEYATAQIQKMWGKHLTKFIGQTMPGGVQFNGERILDDAESELERLEDKLMNDIRSLPDMFIG